LWIYRNTLAIVEFEISLFLSVCMQFIDGKGSSKMGFLGAQGLIRYMCGRSKS
jgi:hypothetical protein